MPRGQIIPRNPDTWLVRLYHGRDPGTGRRRYLNKTVHGERAVAEAELARLFSQIPPRPEPHSTLDEYLDWWLHAAVDGRLRAKTARDYRTLLSLYVLPALGEVRLDRLRPLFDRCRSTLTITRTLERTRGEWRFAGTKHPRSRRTVSLQAEVASLIERHIDSRELSRDRLLFQSSTRGPLYERNLVQRAFKPLIARAGLPDIRLYDLRHTFAALALREGVAARLVSEQLGHASVAFTLDVYGHVLEEAHAAAAGRLSQVLFPPARAARPAGREAAQRKSA